MCVAKYRTCVNIYIAQQRHIGIVMLRYMYMLSFLFAIVYNTTMLAVGGYFNFIAKFYRFSSPQLLLTSVPQAAS